MGAGAINKYPEIHQALLDIAVAALLERGVEPRLAAQLAEAIKEGVRKSDLAGRRVWIDKKKYAVEWMREEVFRRWDRDNLVELMRELEVSEMRIRALYEEARASRKVQPVP